MKNIINDQKYPVLVLGVLANSSSLPANQNSKQQDQLGLKIQKSRPLSSTPSFHPESFRGSKVSKSLSLTPCFSKVCHSLTHCDSNGFNRFLVFAARPAFKNQKSKFKNLFAPIFLPHSPLAA
jgi:hypothetical protein